MGTQLGKLIHIMDNKEFCVGEIVKLGPSKYAEIISKDDFLETNPGAQHQDRCLPVSTMEGEKKLVHASQILVVKDPKCEYDSLKTHSEKALSFLKRKKAG